MAQTVQGTVQIADFGTSPQANQKFYDDWAPQYEENVRAWGYTMPEDCARALRRHCPCPTGQELAGLRLLDAGAGDGLSGRALAAAGFEDITGVDLSPELVRLARAKQVYKEVDVADLSRPLAYASGTFDAATVVGVLTYLEPGGCVLEELCRVVKPGGLVVFTHRSDKVDAWRPRHAALVQRGSWEEVEVSEPLPYLPKNPEFGDRLKVLIHVFRVRAPAGDSADAAGR